MPAARWPLGRGAACGVWRERRGPAGGAGRPPRGFRRSEFRHVRPLALPPFWRQLVGGTAAMLLLRRHNLFRSSQERNLIPLALSNKKSLICRKENQRTLIREHTVLFRSSWQLPYLGLEAQKGFFELTERSSNALNIIGTAVFPL